MTREPPLLEKWKLVRTASHDKALSAGDLAVLIALCDRYGSKYDRDAPALAGHALLASMTGLSRRATIASTKRLIDSGYASVVELGSGTRGTRYSLNFHSGEVASTTDPANPSSDGDDTTVVIPATPLNTASGDLGFTESPPTRIRRQAAYLIGGTDCAAPTAPPVPGAEAPALAGTAQEAFERLWSAYGWHRRRKEALAAWKALAADEVTTEAVISAADAWKVGAGAIQYRMALDTWLKDERYLEEPPKPYEPRATRTKAPKAANDNGLASTANWKLDEKRAVTIEKVEPIETEAEKLVRLHLVDDKGGRWVHDLMHHREADGFANYGNRQHCAGQFNAARYAMQKAGYTFHDWQDGVGKRLVLRKDEGFEGAPPNWVWKAA